MVDQRERHNNFKHRCTQPQYIRQTLTEMKGEFDSETVTRMDRSPK